MIEQLDLFGGEPGKTRETPKKKFVLTPPKNVVEESVPNNADADRFKEVHSEEPISAQPILEEKHPNEEIDITHNNIEAEHLKTIIEQPAELLISNDNSDSSNMNIPEDASLYSKQYYAISEVASMFNVNISLLRFWEKEFDILKPRKNRKGDRLFRPEDIKNLKLIYFLLREKKYTIEGARTFIKKGKKVNEHFEAVETLKNIRKMLVELKESLS